MAETVAAGPAFGAAAARVFACPSVARDLSHAHPVRADLSRPAALRT